jgi:hypothetical protein
MILHGFACYRVCSHDSAGFRMFPHVSACRNAYIHIYIYIYDFFFYIYIYIYSPAASGTFMVFFLCWLVVDESAIKVSSTFSSGSASHVFACVRMCSHDSAGFRMYPHVFTYTNAFICIYVYVYMYIYIYMYIICIYIIACI